MTLSDFHEVWCCDFEFTAPSGERPDPICLVAREYHTGRLVRLWREQFATAPWAAGALFVAYYASAELGCLLALGWSLPTRILDLYAEFRNMTNGLATPCGAGLLGALAYFGLDGIDVSEKEAMRELAMRGGAYTEIEQLSLLDYCQSDVDALGKLLPKMLPGINLPQAVLRGRYMAAAARMEWAGVPVDVQSLEGIRQCWGPIKNRLVRVVDQGYGVYEPTGRRPIDPNSIFGAAVLQTAQANDVDPHRLRDAAEHVWQAEGKAAEDHETALTAARKATGLNANRVAQWENSGHDDATWRGLDTKARELAGTLPGLGIGTGYRQEDGYDDTDYGGRLWDLLREPKREQKPKHHPDILSAAVDLVNSTTTPEPESLTFSAARFEKWLIANDIPWLRLESGSLDLSDDTFRQMARLYPQVAALRELRHSLSQLRLNDLAVGADGRNRCLLSAFRARTGRNQPSNSKFIFGPSCWIRALIQPQPGRALAYIDWEQQEFGIAAALSGDRRMIDAYTSGDPYLTFAKQAGAVPATATKATHKAERDRFKVCALAVQYGMGAKSLSNSIGCPEVEARELLRLHQQTYARFWEWSQAAVDHAVLHGWLPTVFGWRIHVGPDANPRSLANFPMQGNGSEMLRLACCLATERGIAVVAPVHDAILVEGPADDIDAVVEATQVAMREASEVVLAGFALRSDSKVIGPGERYIDPRGEVMWGTVQGLLDDFAPVGMPEGEFF